MNTFRFENTLFFNYISNYIIDYYSLMRLKRESIFQLEQPYLNFVLYAGSDGQCSVASWLNASLAVCMRTHHILGGLFCVDTPVGQLGMSVESTEALRYTEINTVMDIDTPYGCLGPLPLKLWSLTTGPHIGLAHQG